MAPATMLHLTVKPAVRSRKVTAVFQSSTRIAESVRGRPAGWMAVVDDSIRRFCSVSVTLR
jgi:hypothetical protein